MALSSKRNNEKVKIELELLTGLPSQMEIVYFSIWYIAYKATNEKLLGVKIKSYYIVRHRGTYYEWPLWKTHESPHINSSLSTHIPNPGDLCCLELLGLFLFEEGLPPMNMAKGSWPPKNSAKMSSALLKWNPGWW